MGPLPLESRRHDVDETDPRPPGSDALVLESWAQGYMVGSLIIMAFITMANMRKGVRLHKLILVELIAGTAQGLWLFLPNSPGQRVDTWWLSVAAIPLNASWVLHSVISWMKIQPFLSPFWNKVFFWSVLLSIPYWVVEIYANFAYFHYGNPIFNTTRPLELLFRDPWWIVTTVYLFIVIKTQYDLAVKEIILISPRFGIMLASMLVAIIFVICDVLSVTKAIKLSGDMGINPFWKIAFVFKCLTDSVILDDFKTALDRLRAFKMSRLSSYSGDHSGKRTPNPSRQSRSWTDDKARKVHEEGQRGRQKQIEEGIPGLDGRTPTNHPGETLPSVNEQMAVSPLSPAYHRQDVQRHWRDNFNMSTRRSRSADVYAMGPNHSNGRPSLPSRRTRS